MKELVTPSVNLNGNDGMQLVGMALDIKHAIDKTLNVMGEGCDLVHGRNFPAPSLDASLHAARVAREAFDEHRLALTKMAVAFEELALAIHEQVRK